MRFSTIYAFCLRVRFFFGIGLARFGGCVGLILHRWRALLGCAGLACATMFAAHALGDGTSAWELLARCHAVLAMKTVLGLLVLPRRASTLMDRCATI
jgi:hypothetical protein